MSEVKGSILQNIKSLSLDKVRIISGLILPHTEKSFRNLIKSNLNQIVFTIFRLIWNQTDLRLVTLYEKCNYKPN